MRGDGVARIQLEPDAPIARSDDDRLSRTAFARELADQLADAPSTGIVMALTGSWGSGKTSLLNLIAESLGERAVVVRFNPWLVSGTEQLVGVYFEELGGRLAVGGGRLREIGERLRRYGAMLGPLKLIPLPLLKTIPEWAE